jgi:hypothetical protein
MFVEMKVRGLALDAVSNMPIIILRDEEDKRSRSSSRRSRRPAR